MSQRAALFIPSGTRSRRSETGCRIGFLVALALFFLPLCGHAAPLLKVQAPPAKITENQTAGLQVTLEWPASEGPYEIQSPEPVMENLELVQQSQSQETGSLSTVTITYELRPVKRGEARVYAFEVRYRAAAAEIWEALSVPEQRFEVVRAFPAKWILIGTAAGGGLVLILWIMAVFLKELKARRSARNRVPPDPKQRIYAKAEEAIATLSSPDAKEKLQIWSAELKTVVRTYYDIPSTVTTETAILEVLKIRGLPAGESNEISRIFNQLSQMKFAQDDMSSAEMEQLQKTLLQYVHGKIIIGKSNPSS